MDKGLAKAVACQVVVEAEEEAAVETEVEALVAAEPVVLAV